MYKINIVKNDIKCDQHPKMFQKFNKEIDPELPHERTAKCRVRRMMRGKIKAKDPSLKTNSHYFYTKCLEAL